MPPQPTPQHEALCCARGKALIRSFGHGYRFMGPPEAGWAMPVGADRDGDELYENVSFCPFCGARLPPLPG